MAYKKIRANAMQSTNGKARSGHCVECGRMTNEAMGGIRVTIPSQKNGVWVCADHRGKRNLKGYGDENNKKVGSGNSDNITISIELESMGISTHARAYLVKNGFMPTSDCTVDIEYKSPIYTSKQSLAKVMGCVDYMDKNPNYNFRVNHSSCGLHTHFGFDDNHFDFTTLRYDYETLFKPLSDYVNSLDDLDIRAIFGRSFQTYNRALNYYCPLAHENWINIQHSYSVEIRMPRFTDVDKYMRFVECFKKIFKALNTYYISRGAYRTEKHEANAKKASEKMLAIFKKEYADVIHTEWIDESMINERETA